MRDRVALPSTSDPADTALDRLINEALSRYWTTLAITDDDRETTSVAFVVASDTACAVGTTTPLTTTSWLYLRAVKLAMRGINVDIEPKPLGAIEGYGYPDVYGDRMVRYQLLGGVLKFLPSGRVNGYSGTVYYVPDFTPLSGSSTVLDRNGWVQVAVLDTACKVRRMHRLDASDLEVELADARAYVEAVKGRNRGPVPTIVRRRGW